MYLKVFLAGCEKKKPDGELALVKELCAKCALNLSLTILYVGLKRLGSIAGRLLSSLLRI